MLASIARYIIIVGGNSHVRTNERPRYPYVRSPILQIRLLQLLRTMQITTSCIYAIGLKLFIESSDFSSEREREIDKLITVLPTPLNSSSHHSIGSGIHLYVYMYLVVISKSNLKMLTA